MEIQYVKLEIFVPEEAFDAVRDALFDRDAGHIGAYDRCLSWSRVRSCWRPLEGTTPYLGTPWELCEAEEIKIEVCCRRSRLRATMAAVRAAHPYEEPVINVLPLLDTGLSPHRKAVTI
ncbi:MAG: cytochrome C biogenesis protein [Oscillospiraceae bacterium]|nr:cytochrome C biogenesis protein [Oscillospiraceae bacterium]